MTGLNFPYCSLGWEQLEEQILTKLDSILDQLKEIMDSEWRFKCRVMPYDRAYQSEGVHKVIVQCRPQTPFW
jgi:hypothetical protein